MLYPLNTMIIHIKKIENVILVFIITNNTLFILKIQTFSPSLLLQIFKKNASFFFLVPHFYVDVRNSRITQGQTNATFSIRNFEEY